MILRLAKAADGPVLLTFMRDDGSTTSRQVSPLFVHHELMHFAVESVLQLDYGQFGLIAGGRDAEEFDAAARNWLPIEAHHAEVIVCALEAESHSARPEDFEDNVRAICNDVGVPLPADINPALLDAIRAEFRGLVTRWRALPAGGQLDLPFAL